MRLTNQMMVSNLMRNIQSNTKKLDIFNNQLATGKKLNKPSDDPVGTLRSMQLNSILTENEQFISNIGQAIDWLESTESALDKATEVLQRAKELTVRGANGTLDQKQLDMICDEAIQLREHLTEIANSSLGNRYLFSGYKTTSHAFNGSIYQGDQGTLSVEIGKGVSIEYSVSGDQVFQQSLDTLNDLISNLQSGDQATLANTTLSDISNSLNSLLTTRSGLGAKVNRLELALNRFEDVKIRHTQLISKYEDVDIAETIMNLRMQENVYRTSLASGARIIQPSLIDFVK